MAGEALSRVAAGHHRGAFDAGSALAHCDTLDGPVISQARQALEKGT